MCRSDWFSNLIKSLYLSSNLTFYILKPMFYLFSLQRLNAERELVDQDRLPFSREIFSPISWNFVGFCLDRLESSWLMALTE